MAELSGALTLADLKTRYDVSNKRIATIIEILKRQDEVYEDIPFREGNLLTGHQAVLRIGLPTPTWRLFNQGVSATKSTTTPITFPCGMLEDRSEIDKDLAELGGDVNGARFSEAQAHIMGMANEFCTTLWYGDPTANPSTDVPKFPGLAAYYKDDTTANSKDNIIDAGGTDSDNTSVWLVGWSEETVCGIYPRGSQAGLQHEDLGLGDAFDVNNKRFRAYMDRYEWKAGLAVKDWRYGVRIANIKTGTLTSTANQATLVSLMVEATELLPSRGGVTPVFYMNGKTRTALRKGIIQTVSNGGGITFENYAGKMAMMLDGIPVRRSDSILSSEATVS
jgi:hypothetical protein